MQQKKPDFTARLIYGLLVIIPLAVVVVIIAKLIEILESIAKAAGLQSTTSAGFAVILALFILLGLCYGAGTLLHTRIGALSFEKFEKTLLKQIPGYSIIRNILRGFTGEQIEAYKPAYAMSYPECFGSNGSVLPAIPASARMVKKTRWTAR